jgi:hypothetical protein
LISAWATLILAGGLFASALALRVRRRRRLGPAVPDPIAPNPTSATAEPKVPVG